MSFELFVAARYLRKRNLSRFLSFMSTVAIAGVAIGTAALFITFTILDGFERELRTNIIGFAAHIQVGTFRTQIVPDDPARLAAIARLPNVARVSRFLQHEAIVSTRDNIDGVMVKGLDTQGEFTHVRGRITHGVYRLDDSAGVRSVVLGLRLADKLGVRVGDRIVLLGVTDPRTILDAPKVPCVVRGLYETGMSEYFDDVYIFTSLASAQKLFASPDAIDGYDVLCVRPDRVDQTVNAIQQALGYPFDPRSVFSIYRNLFVWIDLQQKLIPIVVGSLIVISVFNIISTLLLFVIEKTQHIGILKSLGASQASIRRIFVLEGLFIGCAGALIGAGIAFALCAAQQQFRFFSLPQDVYYMTTVPIHMTAGVFGVTIAVAVGLSLLSSFVPAWLGARLNPIRSIRFS
jgi:lipoprotein-releasing system permease protein